MITYIAPQDRAKGFLYVSPQIEMILGFSPDEWIQDPELWMKQLHHGDCERVLANVNESYPKIVDAGFICEYRIRAKGGRVVWLREEAILVQDELDQPFLQGIMLDITQSKHAEEQLKNSHEQLRGFAEHIEAVREEERTWIAREIHDELGQVLTGLKIDISWLDKKLTSVCSGDSNHVLSKRTRSMKDLIDSTIQSVRKISTKLRPGILNDLGLLAAVEWQATEYQTRMGIKFEVTSNIDGIELDERRSSAVFRIFQELMTNIARHANATKVSINLKERDGYLILKVRDNGRGITEQESDNVKSLGILGMRERALLLGGKFSITGMPGQGTRATVKIPIT
jgi:PAS domain S-box-containing protein